MLVLISMSHPATIMCIDKRYLLISRSEKFHFDDSSSPVMCKQILVPKNLFYHPKFFGHLIFKNFLPPHLKIFPTPLSEYFWPPHCQKILPPHSKFFGTHFKFSFVIHQLFRVFRVWHSISLHCYLQFALRMQKIIKKRTQFLKF